MEQQNHFPKQSLLGRVGGKGLVVGLMLGLVFGAVATHFVHRAHDHGAATQATKSLYQCPMHPTITQDHPGDCPICGMKLVPVAQAAAASAEGAPAAPRKIKLYRSPMNPQETSPVPRKDEMGMDFIPVYEEESAAATPEVPGLATVSIDPERQQLIGMRTAAVTMGPVDDGWRTVGRVAVDQTRVRKVNVKVEGFVERIFVDFVGKQVAKGAPLFSIYSPELVSAQNEFVLARKTQKALTAAGAPSQSGEDLVASARRKLRLWDIPDREIDRLERTGEPTKTLVLISPISGVVTAKSVVEGSRVSPGDTPYEITDLSAVWVLADIYQSDLARVRVGMPATFTVQLDAGHTFSGKVAFIDPLLDPSTRTVKARLSFPNPTGELRPELFGHVVLQTPAREALRVPTDAIIQSGTKNVVFVAVGEGKLQPREVKLGVSSGDMVEVRAGLTAGEQVVTRANFLIDSESRLKAALSAMGD